jgi:hypothetical protein
MHHNESEKNAPPDRGTPTSADGYKEEQAPGGDTSSKTSIHLGQILVGCFRGAAAGIILFGLLALQIMVSGDIKGGSLYFNAFALQLFIGTGAIAGAFILQDDPKKKPLHVTR